MQFTLLPTDLGSRKHPAHTYLGWQEWPPTVWGRDKALVTARTAGNECRRFITGPNNVHRVIGI